MIFWIMSDTVDTMSDENSIPSGFSSDNHFIQEGIHRYPLFYDTTVWNLGKTLPGKLPPRKIVPRKNSPREVFLWSFSYL